MESQELFNTMMENAIVYLQEKGYIPTQPTQMQRSHQSERSAEEETKILKSRGLL